MNFVVFVPQDILCNLGRSLMAPLSAAWRSPSRRGCVGSDATAKAVDGQAKAMQLSVVDSRIVDVGWLSRKLGGTGPRDAVRKQGRMRRFCQI